MRWDRMENRMVYRMVADIDEEDYLFEVSPCMSFASTIVNT